MKTSIKKQVREEDTKKLSNQLDFYIRNFFGKPTFTKDNQVQEETLTYSDLYSDRMVIVNAIKEGIPYKIFSLIQKISPFSGNEWSSLLDMSSKTLQRYQKSNRRFKPIHSEKIIELAEVTKLGLEVFDNNNGHFRLWLETPSFTLGKRRPIDLLSDSYGKDLVISELVRIEEGIFV
jgi:putative toxin-antitoxin system antitoxin component (TIGR02293 family)